MDIVEISKNELNLNEITEKVKGSSFGAISIFIGTTRDFFEDKKVVKLEYEAHDTMAKKEMKKICNEIRKKWDVGHIAIFHRIGLVGILDASVIIAISSKHRKEAMAAVEFTINTLKLTVPIWKKELYDDGDSSWKENKKDEEIKAFKN